MTPEEPKDPLLTSPPALPPCPKCKSPQIKIATLTDWHSYLRCGSCGETWSMETQVLRSLPKKTA